jgi:hypothetical protein
VAVLTLCESGCYMLREALQSTISGLWKWRGYLLIVYFLVHGLTLCAVLIL